MLDLHHHIYTELGLFDIIQELARGVSESHLLYSLLIAAEASKE